MARLGILLCSGLEADLARVARLCTAARGRGLLVQLFLMVEGVRHLVNPALGELVGHGVEVVACATNAEQLRVIADDVELLGSQHEHAAMVHASDRLLTFT
jgi:sulfur relay (sulfurtransferase) complex TusBCD TusD component (DsrE family)